MPLSSDENIVRAICSDKWDGQRLAPSLFAKEGGTSVSRLALISLEDHWDLFRQYVQRPPQRMLEMLGEIDVGRLQEIGREHDPSIELSVEPKPEEWNPAHAEIPQKITRGLAIKLVSALIRHQPSAK